MPSFVQFCVLETEDMLRLDTFLSNALEESSRSYLKKVIKDGLVSINGKICTKPSQTLQTGQTVNVSLPDPPPVLPEPENLPIEILYEDEFLVVVNKASGMVVHPAPGHDTGTLVNALLYHCPGFQQTGGDPKRPGVVHRLDRDTSGVLVVAKTLPSYTHLSLQASSHTFERRYLALAAGEFTEDRGCIKAGLGRSLVDPSRMAVTGINAKNAITHFETLERFGCACLVRLVLETGRTHQIRVHLRFAGHPILGDPVYGSACYDSWNLPQQTLHALLRLQGQALHAEKLGFVHPHSNEHMVFTSPPPPDFQNALESLRTLH